jgi:SARP family transcriptional regulator, regulator of embCAB operon
MQMEVRILGPLEASVAGVSCIPSARKPRQLFALLAANAGRVVTTSEMTDEIWGVAPPRSAMSTLHTYIRQLRMRLDVVPGRDRRSARDLLVTEHCGYVLAIEPEQVDAGRYDRLSTAGRTAAAGGDYVAAVDMLAAALRLWRGPALADVEAGPQLGIERAGLEESRLGDLELRVDMELRLGRHHRILGELAALCARYPMLESFHAPYMLALYRAGRQWRALEAYQRLRAVLVDQLGIDPSPRVQQLHRAILSGNPTLDDSSFVTSSWTTVGEPAIVMNAS